MRWLSTLSTKKSLDLVPALFRHCSHPLYPVGNSSKSLSHSVISRDIYRRDPVSGAALYHTTGPIQRRLPYTPYLDLPTLHHQTIYHRRVLTLCPLSPRLISRSRASPHTTFRTMSSAAALVESAKKSAAFQAVNDHLLPEYKYVGIGSGSTVVYVVEAIVSKGSDFYGGMTFIPTGSQSKGLIRNAGLTLANLDERPVVDGKPVALDVAFDGADEVDEDLNLIKGGGACLFQEKLVAIAAKRFIAVADYRKQSPRLCTTWKTIPIEVLPLAAPDVLLRLREMGSPSPTVRSGLPSKAGECVTDNGMWIIDAPFAPLLLSKDVTTEVEGRGQGGVWEVKTLADELLKLPGIVEIGLFHGFNGDEAITLGKQLQAQKPVAAYFGLANGEVQVQNAV
ncbi:ribose 5-phosphate isomerase A-domain-containing protein [Dactylonectria estremocensis]|uniref:Ribose-5-phosphate isomerase n=1 Tax=Dactylonectria estremocensis TaxID=1079267 RepID=A0A9P9JLY8_9HYPO|nr:ribose 5-phosphate isomerase A-domain-containing protein [Dactylonectria estremocensis]